MRASRPPRIEARGRPRARPGAALRWDIVLIVGYEDFGSASSGSFSEAWPKKYFQPSGVRT